MQMTRKIHLNQDKTVLFAPREGQYPGQLVEKIMNEFIRAVATLHGTNGYTNNGDVKNAEKFLEFTKRLANPSDANIGLTEAVSVAEVTGVTNALIELSLMEYIVRDEPAEGKAVHGSITMSYRCNPDNAKAVGKVRVTGVIPIFLIEAIRELYEQLKETTLVIDNSIGSLGSLAKNAAKPAPSAGAVLTQAIQRAQVCDNEAMAKFMKLPADQQQVVADLMIQFLSDAVIKLHEKLAKAMEASKK